MVAKLALVAGVACLWGCVAMPPRPRVESRAEQALVVGEPFSYQATGEPLDVNEPDSANLTAEVALYRALRHNPQIQAALARVRQAEADARQTRLLPNPVFDIALRLPSGGGASIIDAGLSAELLSLITRPGRISAADHRLRQSAAAAMGTVLDVAVEVQKQYATVQALDARIAIDTSRRTNLQDVVAVTESRLRAGEAARLDLLTVQSDLSSLDGELLALQAQGRLARITLARLIGQPSAPATWSLTPWSLKPEPALSQERWIELALENRPEIDAIRWELAALGQEVKLARTEALSTGPAGIAAERDGGWSVGPSASLPIPLFDTGSVEKQRRADQVIEQRHALTHAGRIVIEEVRRSIEAVAAARAGLDHLQTKVIPLQELRLKQAQDTHRAGLSDILQLRLAELSLKQTRSQLVELQLQFSHATAERDRAVGGSGISRQPTTSPTPKNKE